ncbi:dUTP diphosphatase [Brevibacillus brevis]|uniref:dUTP diphosphatase n=1 Tax=Brevibacillus brevis TaxID=1393 RepID=UPI001157EA3D|nr:dUTP diphosphatase [Lysinibacillus sp. SDF0063]TQR29409.1 dUTP diphosphatase [Lysinibacillus sp. SDF0063]
MMVNIKVKRLHPDAVIPAYAKNGDAGFDFVAVEDTIIQPGESAKIPTGLAMEVPEGYEIQVRPRSGIGAKTKLRISNAPGTIDSGFRGEIGVLFDNTNKRPEKLTKDNTGSFMGKSLDNEVVRTKTSCIEGAYVIKKGDRIAQGVLAKVPKAEFEVVDELSQSERGTGGFGHTGVTA